MLFKGKIEKGVFIPFKAYRSLYAKFIRNIENNSIPISIEIRRVENTSTAQLNLFNTIIGMVVKNTGSNFHEVLSNLNHLRLMIHTDSGLIFKELSEYNTVELGEFITESLIYLNGLFDLNIEVVIENNKALVKDADKKD